MALGAGDGGALAARLRDGFALGHLGGGPLLGASTTTQATSTATATSACSTSAATTASPSNMIVGALVQFDWAKETSGVLPPRSTATAG